MTPFLSSSLQRNGYGNYGVRAGGVNSFASAGRSRVLRQRSSHRSIRNRRLPSAQACLHPRFFPRHHKRRDAQGSLTSESVETGVARGVSSRFILEALERNGGGRLWSIDQPPPLDPELNGQVGAAVNASCRRRCSYIHGSSRRRLPRLLPWLESIDLFLHDSIHTEYNTRFELEICAWSSKPVLRH